MMFLTLLTYLIHYVHGRNGEQFVALSKRKWISEYLTMAGLPNTLGLPKRICQPEFLQEQRGKDEMRAVTTTTRHHQKAMQQKMGKDEMRTVMMRTTHHYQPFANLCAFVNARIPQHLQVVLLSPSHPRCVEVEHHLHRWPSASTWLAMANIRRLNSTSTKYY